MDPTFHYSLTWFVERQDSSASTFLLSYTHNGLLQYQSENQQLSGRLLFSRPTAKQFQLSILNLDPSDSESNLHVHKSSHFLNVTDIQTGFMVECEISSRSSEKSVLEVTWSRRQSEKNPLTIFTASRDGTLHSTILDRTLV
ncbi:immunoglobulin superfamily member 3-like, partial [Tachysurus ichikawai]